MTQVLKNHVHDPRLGKIILRAISFIESSEILKEGVPAGEGQSSKYLADLHAFRKRSGYYKDGAIDGLDETIDSLSSEDRLVWLAIIETNMGHVAIWLDEQKVPLGILIAKLNSPLTLSDR